MKKESTKLNESVRVLKNENLSLIPEAAPIDVLKFTVRPRKREVERLNEPVKDLKIERCEPEAAAEPKETLNALASPLVSDAASLSEPMRILENDDLSEMLDADANELNSDLA